MILYIYSRTAANTRRWQMLKTNWHIEESFEFNVSSYSKRLRRVFNPTSKKLHCIICYNYKRKQSSVNFLTTQTACHLYNVDCVIGFLYMQTLYILTQIGKCELESLADSNLDQPCPSSSSPGVITTISKLTKMCVLRLTPDNLFFVLSGKVANGGVSMWCELSQVNSSKVPVPVGYI